MTVLKLEGGRFEIDQRPAPAIVTLDALKAGESGGATALQLPNDLDPGEVSDLLDECPIVVLEFPSFTDGRAFSQAALLRNRYGYEGEIRAVGDVLCDQALFMVRCGFDALDIGGGTIDGFRRAISEFSCFYQSGADGSERIRRTAAARRDAA